MADTPVSLQRLCETSRRCCCLLEHRNWCSRIATQSGVLGGCEYCVSSTLAVLVPDEVERFIEVYEVVAEVHVVVSMFRD